MDGGWRQRVDDICDQALRLAAADRPGFLDRACGSDAQLRLEVDSLLAHDSAAVGFLGSDVAALAARDMTTAHDIVGRRFGDYEISAKLGEGGMGEVYRARDRRLGRDVAIKILPSAFATDRDRMHRFEREARLLATVNHRFIGAIYGTIEIDGVPALVLELVDGDTLFAALARGPLPLARALTIAAQVADALDHAHRRGITHRDLKPANIMLTRDGVRLLDFGVGKWTPPLTDATMTRPSTLTGEGALVGTLHYMSPEQLEGRAADARSDIFAFGAVLFEMLSGRKAFDGPSQASIIAAVMQKPAPTLPADAGIPPPVARVMAKCLEKDPAQRWQSAGDLRDALGWLASDDAAPATVAPRTVRKAATAASGAAAVIAISLLGWSAWSWRGNSGTEAPTPIRFTLPSPPGRMLPGFFDISDDGKRIVFGIQPENPNAPVLHVRHIDRFDAPAIPGTERAASVAISPDGEWIAFMVSGVLKKVRVSTDAAPITLAENIPAVFQIIWPAEDTILILARNQPVRRVSANGGPPQAITTIQASTEVDHHGPELLPDANVLLFTVHSTRNRFSIVAQRLDSQERKTIIESGFAPRVLESGHLVFGRGSSLLAVPFDARTLEVRGEPVAVLERVSADPTSGVTDARISRTGTLIYQSGLELHRRLLVWVDRNGRETPLPIEQRNFEYPTVSPDGTQIAFGVNEDGRRDIFTYELASGRLARLTQDGANWGPIWTADGRGLVYGHDAEDSSQVILHRNGTNTFETLGASVNTLWPAAASADARHVLVTEQPPTEENFLSLLANGALSRLRPPSANIHAFGRLSPDGRWVAYEEIVAGRREVFVQGYPDGGTRRQITVDGGRVPIWRRDGKELYFRHRSAVFAVPIDTSAGLTWGKPVALFAQPLSLAGFDVAPDGRFLMIRPGPDEGTTAPVSIVANWLTELITRVPLPR
jgi:Tol biopolymer transport system component